MWKAALASLKRSDPPTFALVSNESFLGAEGDLFKVQIPLTKKDFSYVKLNQPKRREIIESALTSALGRPAHFAAVLENEPDLAQDAGRLENQQLLIDAFGRDNVRIDEGGEQ